MSYYFNYANDESHFWITDDTVTPHNLEEKFLQSHIDSEFGLLDKLLGNGILYSRQYHFIREKGSRIERNLSLLEIAKAKNLFPQLLDTLKEDGQSHIKNFLHILKNPYDRTFGDNLPLTYKERKTIDLNRDIFVSLLRNSSELAQELYWKKVINERQKDHICSLFSTKANDSLLDILQRRSIQNYKDTIECLRESNQTLVADILDGQVIGRICCRLEKKSSNLKRQKFENVDGDLISVNNLEDDRQFGLKFVQCKGGDLVLYFHFASHSELQQMNEKVQNNHLETLMQNVFCKYFPQLEKPISSTAEWSSCDYERCSQCFGHISNKDVSGLLPELLEMSLAKAALMRIYHDNVAKRQTDRSIFCNLASVAPIWWNSMKNKRLKNKIRKFSKVYFQSAKMRSTIIRNNRDFLKEVINPDEIIFPLESCGCLTRDQVSVLKRLRNGKDKNHELLVMLQDFSSQKYSKFIDCLFLENQTPAALVLERGGETVKVRVRNRQDARTKLFEKEFNERFQQLQRGNALILCDLINVSVENTLDEVFVLHAKQNKDVELWFWCKTEDSLNQLKDLCDDDLRKIIHRLYRRLIPEHYASLKPQIIQKNNTFVSYFAERQMAIRHMGTISVFHMNRNSQWFTSLSDKIYVIQHEVIWVYNSKLPYERQKTIELNPSTTSDTISIASFRTISIASCNINKCLYISDPASSYIVKMEPDFDNRMSNWFNEGGDYKISITRKGDVLLFDTSPSVRIISYEGTVKRTIPLASHFSQTQFIQEITPDLVALSYQKQVPDQLPDVGFVSFIAIMCLDENGTILREFELQRENVCLTSFRYGDLLIGHSGLHVSGYSSDLLFRRSTNSDGSHSNLLLRNKDVMLQHWLVPESKVQDILTTNWPKTHWHNRNDRNIHCIHFASDLRQLFFSSDSGLQICKLKYTDEEDD